MTVYHGINHTFLQAGQDPSQVYALLTAPTGTGLFNISGITIHSVLSLPAKEKRFQNKTDYIPVGNDKKNELRCKLQHLKILIIDEVSMVGSQTLINIHKRLQEIMGEKSEDIQFGSISIMTVGDLLQLPPVGDSPVFASPRNPLHCMSMSL